MWLVIVHVIQFLEVIKVFEQLDDAQKYVMAHPRAALLPRKVIKHGEIKKQK